MWAIRRLQVNNSATENKKFKPYQVLEAFKDPKCWLFALHIFLQEIPNNLGNQRSLLIVDYGFSTLDTTLLNMVSPQLPTWWSLPSGFADLRAS